MLIIYARSSTLRCSDFIIIREVAILAETFAIMSLTVVGACPGFLRSASSMVAIHAHALRIISTVGVRAVHNLSLVKLLVGARDAWYLITVLWRSFIGRSLSLDNRHSSCS